MRVANTTPFVQHFGGSSIEPGRSALVDNEWREHPVFRRLVAEQKLMVADDHLSEEIMEKAEDKGVGFTPPTKPADPQPAIFSSELEDFAEWHTNKAKAFVKKSDDLETLKGLLEVEERPKVASALRDRLDTLEGRP